MGWEPPPGDRPSRLWRWAAALRRRLSVLVLALRDPRTPALAQFIAVFVVAYALSPIDLIPDFIPILGLVDDLILVPAGIWLVLRLIPRPILEELADIAEREPVPLRRSLLGAALVIGIWAYLAAIAAIYAVRQV